MIKASNDFSTELAILPPERRKKGVISMVTLNHNCYKILVERRDIVIKDIGQSLLTQCWLNQTLAEIMPTSIVQLLSSKIVHFDDKSMKLCQITTIPKANIF